LCGILSAFLGTLAGCGLVSYSGIDWVEINMTIPFIMIGEEVSPSREIYEEAVHIFLA
jgi:hypothetical protein